MTSVDLANPEAVILAAFEQLSPQQRRLARYLLDNLTVVAFESANEIATRADVSPATVVRFCQGLGYEGYPEFQQAIRDRMPKTLTAVQRGERDLSGDGSGTGGPGDILARVFQAETGVLQRTLRTLDAGRFQAAAERLAAASRVLVLGVGASSGPATYFAHSLAVMGIDAHLFTAGGLPLAAEVANLPPDSVLLTLSVWRYIRDVAETAQAARQRGIYCIAVSDSPVSPLAAQADDAFVVATEGVAHTVALSAMMALLTAFVAMLSHLRPQQTLNALRAVDALYRTRHLLVSD